MDTFEFPRDVAERKTLTVSLGSLKIEWDEPVKFRADVLLAKWRVAAEPIQRDLVRVSMVSGKASSVEEAERLLASDLGALGAASRVGAEAPAFLGWIAEALPLTVKQIKTVEQECTANDVTVAFLQMGDFLTRPFVGGQQSTEQAQAQATPSPHGKPETQPCSAGESPSMKSSGDGQTPSSCASGPQQTQTAGE